MTATAVDLNAALARYSEARKERTEAELEYAPMLADLASLKEEEEAAKAELTAAMASTTIDYVEDPDFEVTLVKTDRGAYNVDRLPKVPAVLDACTLTIDRKAVEKLVKRGVLSQVDAEAAWESKPAAPFVRVTIKTTAG